MQAFFSKKIFLTLLAGLFVFTSSISAQQVEKLTIATWNVENLFDTVINHPEKRDDEYTPQSWRRWTETRYREKLDNLAWAINEMKPDILGMTEVENRGVLNELNKHLLKNHGWNLPYIGHVETTDYRGIDNAVMSRYPIKNVEHIKDWGRRGLLIVTIDVDTTEITVFVNHWRSQIGDAAKNIVTRTQEALRARTHALKLLENEDDASFVILGDFNEDLDSAELVSALRALPSRSAAQKSPKDDPIFYNLMGDIPSNQRGTYYYARRRVWNTFDTIIVAPEMLLPSTKDGPDWRVQDATNGVTKVFKRPQMCVTYDGRPKSYRRVRIKNQPNSYYEQGYSDHFPVITTLIREQHTSTNAQ